MLADIVRSTEAATKVLDRLARGETSGFAPLDALRTARSGGFVAWEHDPGTRPHLLEHAYRAVSRNLGALEHGTSTAFGGLSAGARDKLDMSFRRVQAHGLIPLVRLALVLLDFAKGGSDKHREQWSARGADLTIHNEAAAHLLQHEAALDALPFGATQRDLLIEVIRHHGLAGQRARGETPLVAFESWVAWLRRHGEALGAELEVTTEQAVSVAAEVLHLIDVLDTEAVRAGLVDDRLFADLQRTRDLWTDAVGRPELMRTPRPLEDRFARLRRQALDAGEPHSRVDAALAAVAARRGQLDQLLPLAQLWYFEPATHRLSAEAALRLLLLGIGQAVHQSDVDCSAPFHLSFEPLVDALGGPGSRTSYRVRVVEALLLSWELGDLAQGVIASDVLAGFTARIGGTTAISLDLKMSEEADALVTLLSLYERRSSVAFHQILKLLCDAYGLRKDEFDRLANEAQYLTTMNSARTDKERMLDYARPGTIVEIGPGGGVVLDLLEQRFQGSDIVGIDVSDVVVEELERRRKVEERSWRIVAGDAFELGAHVPRADTVIFCSLMHEIYSYVERGGAKFTFTAVRELLEAAYETLRPGGRIIIRDGVKPPPGRRVIEFIDPDGPDYLRRFQQDFEGRAISVQWLDERRAALSTADAMEFLYCYTWGPSSYPYEVRELYGIMERDEYERAVLGWLPGLKPVTIPAELQSYLQPGYVDGLSPKVVLTDESGEPVALPDSNAIWVFERE